MNKTTLTLLALSASLVTLTLTTNAATASVTHPVISAPQQLVNLNRATSMLNVTAQESNPIKDQLGCNCPACLSARTQMPG